MIKEITKHSGEIIIISKNKDGSIKKEILYNRVTDDFLDAIANILDGISPDYELKYFAIGDDASALTDNPTTLGNEIVRFPLDTSNLTNIGEFTTTFTVLELEAVFEWQEIGFFGGASASISVDSGVLISRILFYKDKTSLEEIDISRIDKFRRN